jgi:flagellar motor component MotA
MKSKVKKTIMSIFYLIILGFLLLGIAFLLVTFFIAPTNFTLAIFFSVSFIIIISQSTSEIKNTITKITELLAEEEKEQKSIEEGKKE